MADVKAGGAYVEIYGKDATGPGIAAAQSRISKLGSSLRSALSVGAGIAGGLTAAATAAVHRAVSLASDLVDRSARTGLGIEALQELSHAAKQTGASAEDLESGIRRMQDVIAEAANGSETAAEKLARVGLSIEAIRGLNPDAQFEMLATAISRIQDPAERTSAVMDLFGKSGAQLIPMLMEGAEGIRKFRMEAQDLGLVLRGEDAKALDDFGDKLDVFTNKFNVMVARIASDLLPIIEFIIQRISKTAEGWDFVTGQTDRGIMDANAAQEERRRTAQDLARRVAAETERTKNQPKPKKEERSSVLDKGPLADWQLHDADLIRGRNEADRLDKEAMQMLADHNQDLEEKRWADAMEAFEAIGRANAVEVATGTAASFDFRDLMSPFGGSWSSVPGDVNAIRKKVDAAKNQPPGIPVR